MAGKKVSSVKDYRKLTERKIDSELWKEIMKLSKGTTKEKISAIDKIFKKHYNLPEESIKISKTLADKKQPLKIRLQIAKNLVKYQNIPYGIHQSLLEILSKSDDEEINKIVLKSPLYEMAKKFQGLIIPIVKQFQEFTKKIDWEKFRKIYHISMIRDLKAVKDDRITSILSQVLTEYWLDVFIKNLFQNPQDLVKLSFDNKRKILFGLKIIKSTTNNDLKKLDDIRAEYAHNFVVDDKKVLKHLKKMDCYKNMKFGKNSKNNNRIKKCAIKIVVDLMDIEEKFIIEVNKKKK